MIKTGGHIEESTANLFACFLSMLMAIATNKLMSVTLSQDWRPLILTKQPKLQRKTEKLHRNKRFLTQSMAEETKSNLKVSAVRHNQYIGTRSNKVATPLNCVSS
jgi:hypothetical protein